MRCYVPSERISSSNVSLQPEKSTRDSMLFYANRVELKTFTSTRQRHAINNKRILLQLSEQQTINMIEGINNR